MAGRTVVIRGETSALHGGAELLGKLSAAYPERVLNTRQFFFQLARAE